MKYLTLAFLVLLPFVALAQEASSYEVPVDAKDFAPPQEKWDHFRTQVKQVTCRGRSYGVLYKSFWGWSQGSTLLGVCAWENRTTIKACEADQDPDTIFCYNKVIEFYRLEARHPKGAVPQNSPVPDVEMPPEASR